MSVGFGLSPFEATLDQMDACRKPPASSRPRVAPATLARIRLAVYRRGSFRCQHCLWAPEVPEGYDGRHALGELFVDGAGRARTRLLELDHVIPYVLGGKFEEDNLQALCNSCNARKGASL
jgi:hypothetical protein